MDNKRKEKLLKKVSKDTKNNKKAGDKLKMPKLDLESDKGMKKSKDTKKKEDKLKTLINKEKKAFAKTSKENEGATPNADMAVFKTNDNHLLDWLKSRYLFLAAIVLVVVLVIGITAITTHKSHKKTAKKTDTTTQQNATTEVIEEENPLIPCDNEAISTLITSYMAAMRDVDINTMMSLDLYQKTYENDVEFKNAATVIEDYKDITVYTKKGPFVNGYTAYVVTNIKFKDIDKTCQGMFQYIVRMEADGSFKLDTTPADDIESDEIFNKMTALSQSEDVLTLIDGVNQQCQADIEADEKLKAYVQGTLQKSASVAESENAAQPVQEESVESTQEPVETEETANNEEGSKTSKSSKKKNAKKKKK